MEWLIILFLFLLLTGFVAPPRPSEQVPYVPAARAFDPSARDLNDMYETQRACAVREAAQAAQDIRNAEIVRKCTEHFHAQQAYEARMLAQAEARQRAEEARQRSLESAHAWRVAHPTQAFYQWLRE